MCRLVIFYQSGEKVVAQYLQLEHALSSLKFFEMPNDKIQKIQMEVR